EESVRYGALAALVQEWWKTLHDVQEPQVAAVKLAWWREELQRAAEGEPRHPLTQSLFADGQVREVPLSCWTAVVEAALLAIDAPPPADFDAQRLAAAPLADAIAGLETRVWFGSGAERSRAAAVVALANLVAGARALAAEVGHGRTPLPMNLLARHGLAIEGLGVDGADRRAALRDYAGTLRDALNDVATIPGPLTLFRAVALHHDLRSLGRATHAADPLQALCAPDSGFGNLLQTWREARMWRGVSHTKAKS
ncbi:MAG TPA: squalene/phytoene synthase family protein, partial [Rhodanobacteraceae bacterium]|nr:squalene/phytoene synthase family protein [Rhodanobacteraceae bacterium]